MQEILVTYLSTILKQPIIYKQTFELYLFLNKTITFHFFPTKTT